MVFCLAATLVVAGCGGDGGSMGAVPTPPPSRAATAPQPTKPSKPVSSAPKPAACNGCFPGITYAGLVKTLKTKGYACKVDRILGTECEKGIMELHIETDYKLKNQISNIDVTGRASSKGEYPQGPSVAFTRLQAALPVALPMFIADPAVRKQIIAFAAKNSSHAATGPDAVRDAKAGGFRISCQGVHGFTVRKNGRSASSYSTSVDIYGPSAY
ncbi:hypothetical protein GCM10022235_20050 [Kribbella ginsengisoli]|uniref:Uncharacterized protein n=1 Tax=Kribbella ginsengisoli TaxID=363865 RepID=A0ABP6WKI5_9ACTN